MATPIALALHPTAVRAPRGLGRRAARLASDLVLGVALAAGATVAVTFLLLLLVIAAPLAAGAVAWLVWRSGDGAARQARRVRARLRRRARALGLVVLAGSHPRLLPRLAAARGRAPRAVR